MIDLECLDLDRCYEHRLIARRRPRGLAFKLENQDRLTLKFENVGTRDYQPPWSYGMRLEEVKPTFDVFSLGKLMWAMVSGRPKFPLWYFDEEPNDLREMFPKDPGVRFVNQILAQCVVQREEQAKLPDAASFLEQVDEAIEILSAGAQIPSVKRPMRCRFCGVGYYERFMQLQKDGFADGRERHWYECSQCGHLTSFMWRGGELPPAWERLT